MCTVAIVCFVIIGFEGYSIVNAYTVYICSHYGDSEDFKHVENDIEPFKIGHFKKRNIT